MSKSIAGYLIFSLSVILALTVLMFKGSTAPFFTLPFVILAVVVLFFLFGSFLFFLFKKRALLAISHLLAAMILLFYGFNERSFVWAELSISDFNESEKSMILKEKPELVEYGYGDTEKLKNVEKAVFNQKGKSITAELNSPVVLDDNVKIFVTGRGEKFLVTRSEYLFLIGFFGVIFTILLFVFAIKTIKEKR